LEALVILAHHSDLVLDIREGYSQEGVDFFECFAELMQYHEKILKHNVLDLVVPLQHLLSVHDGQLNIEIVLLAVGLHGLIRINYYESTYPHQAYKTSHIYLYATSQIYVYRITERASR